MTLDPVIACHRFSVHDLGRIRQVLLDVYVEVYADRLVDPFFSAERFIDRLDSQITAPRWEAVVGYHSDQPIGYAYGALLRPNTTLWQNMDPVPPDAFIAESAGRTFFMFELMLRSSWRKRDLSKHLHDALLAGRAETRVALTVEHDHPRVRALYESWGYINMGADRPMADAPLYDVMVLDRPTA